LPNLLARAKLPDNRIENLAHSRLFAAIFSLFSDILKNDLPVEE